MENNTCRCSTGFRGDRCTESGGHLLLHLECYDLIALFLSIYSLSFSIPDMYYLELFPTTIVYTYIHTHTLVFFQFRSGRMYGDYLSE